MFSLLQFLILANYYFAYYYIYISILFLKKIQILSQHSKMSTNQKKFAQFSLIILYNSKKGLP